MRKGRGWRGETRKQLVEELPWRQIASSDPEVVGALVEALQKEANNWEVFASVEPLSDEQACAALIDPGQKKRCLRSRVCYRDRNCGVGNLEG